MRLQFVGLKTFYPMDFDMAPKVHELTKFNMSTIVKLKSDLIEQHHTAHPIWLSLSINYIINQIVSTMIHPHQALSILTHHPKQGASLRHIPPQLLSTKYLEEQKTSL